VGIAYDTHLMARTHFIPILTKGFSVRHLHAQTIFWHIIIGMRNKMCAIDSHFHEIVVPAHIQYRLDNYNLTQPLMSIGVIITLTFFSDLSDPSVSC